MPVYTLPEGYVWLEDAFKRAWSEIESDQLASPSEPASAFSAAVGGGNWHYEPSHAADLARSISRKRVEKLMRNALAYGGVGALRAMTLQPQTGQPGEVPDREEWAMKMSVGFDGLRTYVCHLTSPGPYKAEKEGYPIFVSERELEAFVCRHRPATKEMAHGAKGNGTAATFAAVPADASALQLTRPMCNLHTALCEIYKDEHGGIATDQPAKRIAAVLAWRNQQKTPRNILPGDIARSIRRLDKDVFTDGKPVKLKGK